MEISICEIHDKCRIQTPIGEYTRQMTGIQQLHEIKKTQLNNK